MRSHKGNTVLHRINHDEKRILGSAMRKSILLLDRMVQSQERGIHSNGRGYPLYVSEFQCTLNVLEMRTIPEDYTSHMYVLRKTFQEVILLKI